MQEGRIVDQDAAGLMSAEEYAQISKATWKNAGTPLKLKLKLNSLPATMEELQACDRGGA
jgi:hypothetical protein